MRARTFSQMANDLIRDHAIDRVMEGLDTDVAAHAMDYVAGIRYVRIDACVTYTHPDPSARFGRSVGDVAADVAAYFHTVASVETWLDLQFPRSVR